MKENFYSERTVQGRREYKCQFCPKPIAKGEAHVCVSSRDAGKIHGHRAHLVCHDAATGQPAPLPRRAAA